MNSREKRLEEAVRNLMEYLTYQFNSFPSCRCPMCLQFKQVQAILDEVPTGKPVALDGRPWTPEMYRHSEDGSVPDDAPDEERG